MNEIFTILSLSNASIRDLYRSGLLSLICIVGVWVSTLKKLLILKYFSNLISNLQFLDNGHHLFIG